MSNCQASTLYSSSSRSPQILPDTRIQTHQPRSLHSRRTERTHLHQLRCTRCFRHTSPSGNPRSAWRRGHSSTSLTHKAHMFVPRFLMKQAYVSQPDMLCNSRVRHHQSQPHKRMLSCRPLIVHALRTAHTLLSPLCSRTSPSGKGSSVLLLVYQNRSLPRKTRSLAMTDLCISQRHRPCIPIPRIPLRKRMPLHEPLTSTVVGTPRTLLPPSHWRTCPPRNRRTPALLTRCCTCLPHKAYTRLAQLSRRRWC